MRLNKTISADGKPIQNLADQIFERMDRELEEANKEITADDRTIIFSKYVDDPVLFGEEVLKEVYTEDVKEEMRAIVTNVKVIARSANATGKTHSAARIAVWAFLCKPKSQIWTAAAPPEDNLRKLLWGEISAITVKNPHLFIGCKISLSSMEIVNNLDPQNFITGVTIPQEGDERNKEARFSGKHAPYLLFILDEADAIPQAVYNGIESCMSGGDAHLLLLFNPRKNSGPAFDLERKKGAKVVILSALRHPNVITGNTIFAGAVTRKTVVERIDMWTRQLIDGEEVDKDSFQIPQYLVGSRYQREDGSVSHALKSEARKIVDARFSYMVLGEYPSAGANQLISRAAIERCIWRRNQYLKLHQGIRPDGIKPTMSLDPSEMGDDLSVVTMKYGGFIDDQIIWKNKNIPDTADEAIMIYKVNECESARIDANGLGLAIPPLMERAGCVAHRIMVTELVEADEEHGEFERVRDQMLFSLKIWIERDPTAMLPDDEELTQELLAYTYTNEKGKIQVIAKKELIKRIGNRSPDKSSSLALQFAKLNADQTASEVESFSYA